MGVTDEPAAFWLIEGKTVVHGARFLGEDLPVRTLCSFFINTPKFTRSPIGVAEDITCKSCLPVAKRIEDNQKLLTSVMKRKGEQLPLTPCEGLVVSLHRGYNLTKSQKELLKSILAKEKK